MVIVAVVEQRVVGTPADFAREAVAKSDRGIFVGLREPRRQSHGERFMTMMRNEGRLIEGEASRSRAATMIDLVLEWYRENTLSLTRGGLRMVAGRRGRGFAGPAAARRECRPPEKRRFAHCARFKPPQQAAVP
jgi:hypothetical protein